MTTCWRAARFLQCDCEGCSSVLIDLPQRTQRDGFSCGTCCLASVYKYMERRITAAPASPIDGIDPRKVEYELRAKGFRICSGEMSIDDLQFHAKKHRPVICLVQQGGMGHWVLSRGVSRGYVYLMDPAAECDREKVESFLSRWKDSYHDGTEYDRWGIAVSPD